MLIERHSPELFLLLEHVGLAAFGSDGALAVVSHVDAFIGVQRDALSFLDDVDLNRRHVAAGAEHHPSVDGVPDCAVLLLEGFFSSHQQRFVSREQVHLLDAASDLFTRLDKEALGSSLEYLFTELVVALLVDGVEDVAELIFSENSALFLLDEQFVHVQDVAASHLGVDEPLFSSLALFAVDVHEGLLGLHQESSGVVDDSALDDGFDHFIDAWDVEALVSDKPFLTGLAVFALVVFGLALGSDLERLVGRYNDGGDVLHDLNFHTRDVKLRPELDPFIASHSLLAFGIDVVSDCFELDRTVSEHNWYLFYSSQGFTGI